MKKKLSYQCKQLHDTLFYTNESATEIVSWHTPLWEPRTSFLEYLFLGLNMDKYQSKEFHYIELIREMLTGWGCPENKLEDDIKEQREKLPRPTTNLNYYIALSSDDKSPFTDIQLKEKLEDFEVTIRNLEKGINPGKKLLQFSNLLKKAAQGILICIDGIEPHNEEKRKNTHEIAAEHFERAEYDEAFRCVTEIFSAIDSFHKEQGISGDRTP